MSTTVYSNKTYLAALARICDVPSDIADALSSIEPDQVTNIIEFLSLFQNYKTEDKGEIDKAAVATLSKLTRQEWIRQISADHLYKCTFINPIAPLLGILSMTGKTQVSADTDPVITLHHKFVNQKLCKVSDVMKAVTPAQLEPILVNAKAFAMETAQGAVIPLDVGKLCILNLIAPFVKFETDALGKLEIKVDPYLYDHAKLDYDISIGDKVAPYAAGGIQYTTDLAYIKTIVKTLNNLQLVPPDTIPVMYYIAEMMKKKNITVNFKVPKLPADVKVWPKLTDDLKFPVIFKDGVVQKPLKVLASDINRCGDMTYALASWKQSTQNSLTLHFFGSLCNLGYSTAIALQIASYMETHKITHVVCTDAMIAATLKSFQSGKYAVTLVGGVCSNPDVVVTSWHQVVKSYDPEIPMLWTEMPQELQSALADLKTSKLHINFSNLEKLLESGVDTHQTFFLSRDLTSIELSPWSSRPTVIIQFGDPTEARSKNSVILNDVIRVCNAIARKVFSNFLYHNFMRFTTRCTWNAPALHKEVEKDLIASFAKITQSTKKAKATGLALDSVLAATFDLSQLQFGDWEIPVEGDDKVEEATTTATVKEVETPLETVLQFEEEKADDTKMEEAKPDDGTVPKPLTKKGKSGS